MLPKPEKTKKINNNFLSDSEITQESPEVIALKKIKTKRRLVLISLICTAGLSLVFWVVRGAQSFINQPKSISFNFRPNLNFKFPSIKFISNNNSSSKILASTLDKLLSTKKWSVAIFKNDVSSQPIYQFNYSQTDINNFIVDLTKVKATESSSITSELPEGLLFQEIINTSSSPYFYGNIITLPNGKLIFIIKDLSDLPTFQQDISQFINLAYWYSIQQN